MLDLTPDELLERWPFLTPGESRAVLLYERGLTQRAIAATLGLSRATVRDALDSAERRIRAHQRAQEAIPGRGEGSRTPNEQEGTT